MDQAADTLAFLKLNVFQFEITMHLIFFYANEKGNLL